MIEHAPELRQLLQEQNEILRELLTSDRLRSPKEGYTIQEVSAHWGVKLFTVEQAVASGELEAHRLNKHNTIILREDVLRWIRKHRVETKPGYVPKAKPANARSRASQSEAIPLPKQFLAEREKAIAAFRQSGKGR